MSRIHFGFGFIVNPDPDPIIEYAPYMTSAGHDYDRRLFVLSTVSQGIIDSRVVCNWKFGRTDNHISK